MTELLFDMRPEDSFPLNWPHHGKSTGYSYGCRCSSCRDYHRRERKATARAARFGDIRTCRRCHNEYDRVKDFDAGTKYCGECRRAGVAYDVKEAAKPPSPMPCQLCAGQVRADSRWNICATCKEQLPDYIWRQLRHHNAPLEFVTRVIESPVCQICGEDLVQKSKAKNGRLRSKMHIDHDHNCCDHDRSCGRCLRGILCEAHNHGLGKFGDNPDLLEAAAKYLREAGK